MENTSKFLIERDENSQRNHIDNNDIPNYSIINNIKIKYII